MDSFNPFDLDYSEPENADAEEFTPAQAARKPAHGGPKFHNDLIQGSDEWLAARCGLITASEMKMILTPTLKLANNDKSRAHFYELAFQRLTGFVEPQYISDAMMRGQQDEGYAREAYIANRSDVEQVGFITNDLWGFTIGYSPDGLVGDDGLIEVKSRGGKYQVQTIANDAVPEEYWLQLQTGLLVTGRKWIDFISYCGGLPVFIKRVEPDPQMQDAIIAAVAAAEARITEIEQEYRATLAAMPKVINTERRIEQEMYL